MKQRNKKTKAKGKKINLDLSTIAYPIGVVIFLLICSFLLRPNTSLLPEHSFESETLKADQLYETRQIATIKLDSVVWLLNHIKSSNPTMFDFEKNSNHLLVATTNKTINIKLFNTIFYNDKSKEDLDVFTNLPIQTFQKQNTYGFKAKILTESNFQVIQLPLEVLHSLILKYKNLKK